jgi:hypothetical protein
MARPGLAAVLSHDGVTILGKPRMPCTARCRACSRNSRTSATSCHSGTTARCCSKSHVYALSSAQSQSGWRASSVNCSRARLATSEERSPLRSARSSPDRARCRPRLAPEQRLDLQRRRVQRPWVAAAPSSDSAWLSARWVPRRTSIAPRSVPLRRDARSMPAPHVSAPS